MASKESSPQNFALILMIVGIVAYIGVDTGLIRWPANGFSSANNMDKSSPEESLLAYSKKLSDELSNVESEIKQERMKLSSLQSEVAKYEKNVRRHKSNLAELEKEIKTLSNLKQTLVGVSAKIAKKENKAAGLRSFASENKVDAIGDVIWSTPPSSLADIESKLREMTKAETAIEPVTYDSKEYFRLKTRLGFDETSGIYLTARGMKQARALTEGAIGLGYSSIAIAHNPTDVQTTERVGVLRRFLQERYGNQMDVRSLQVSGDQTVTNNLELWIGKGG